MWLPSSVPERSAQLLFSFPPPVFCWDKWDNWDKSPKALPIGLLAFAFCIFLVGRHRDTVGQLSFRTYQDGKSAAQGHLSPAPFRVPGREKRAWPLPDGFRQSRRIAGTLQRPGDPDHKSLKRSESWLSRILPQRARPLPPSAEADRQKAGHRRLSRRPALSA